MNVVMVIQAERCELCSSREMFRLPADWQDQVAAGKALPIAGCGNTWHYATSSLGDVATCDRVDVVTTVAGNELRFVCDRDRQHPGRHHAVNVEGVELSWAASS